MRGFVESVAQAIAGLTVVSRAQWVLRVGAALAMLATLALVVTAGSFGPNATLLAIGVVPIVLWQSLRPDSDAGVVAMLLLVLATAAVGSPEILFLFAVGLLMFLAHAAWALAATAPAHGVVGRSAWRLAGRAAVIALVVGVLGGIGVLTLTSLGTSVSAWLMIPGVLALIVLFVVLAPRERDRIRM